MSWIKSLQSKVKGKAPAREPSYPTTAPPAWQPAPEQVHALGLHSDAPEEEYEAAETFCQQNPPFPSRLLSSEAVDRIRERGCGAWRLELPPGDPARTRSVTLRNGGETGGKTGVITVESAAGCRDVCILSDLPLLAGLYDTRGKRGVYFEIKVLRMDVDGVIAVGKQRFRYTRHDSCGQTDLQTLLRLRRLQGRPVAPTHTGGSPGGTVSAQGFTSMTAVNSSRIRTAGART